MSKPKRVLFTALEFQDICSKKFRITFADDPKNEVILPFLLNKKEAYWNAYKFFCAVLQHQLLAGKDVSLPGIGIIHCARRRPWKMRHTGFTHGETVNVPEKLALTFRANPKFKMLTDKYTGEFTYGK